MGKSEKDKKTDILDIVEETLLQWNHPWKIDRNQTRANGAHVNSAFVLEILRNKMSHSIGDSMCDA